MGYASDDEEIRLRIRAAVAAAGVSERSVFLEAGISDGRWHNVIRKGNGGLRASEVLAVARALKVPPSTLMPQWAVAA